MPIRSAFAILVALAASLQAEPVNPKIIERYKQMLDAKPEEGIAMDRLWKAALESGGTDPMIAEYKARNTFAGRMVLGHLLRRAGREEEAASAFRDAAKLDAQSALPSLALAKLESGRGHPQQAAASL